MTARKLVTVHRGSQTLLKRVRLAASFWKRWRGLLYYRQFPEIDGLLLYPCNQVHSIGMHFPLDLIFIDRQRRVVALVPAWKPNRITPRFKQAYYVLEARPDTVQQYQIKLGDSLWW